MSAVRCSRCGDLVPRDEYAAHIPCQGPRTGPTATPDEPVGWGSLILPPGDLQRGDTPTPVPPGEQPQHLEPRLGTARRRVLDLLRDGQWHASHAITAPAVGGSEGLRRLRELREAGFNIDKRRATAGVWEYRLAAS